MEKRDSQQLAVNSEQLTVNSEQAGMYRRGASTAIQAQTTMGGYQGRVSPVVARMVKAHGLNLDEMAGTGKNGRITKHDIQSYLDRSQSQPPSLPLLRHSSAQASQSPTTNNQPPPLGTLQPHTPMRRRIAEHMVLSKETSPHATTVFELDFHTVAQHRQVHKADFERRGVKLTYMAYIASAVIQGLQAVPLVNGRFQDDGIFLHDQINLGIATAIDNGLVVPVIRQAEQLNLFGLAQKDYRTSAKGAHPAVTACRYAGRHLYDYRTTASLAVSLPHQLSTSHRQAFWGLGQSRSGCASLTT